MLTGKLQGSEKQIEYAKAIEDSFAHLIIGLKGAIVESLTGGVNTSTL